jgi:cysteinyl-tRNA synthetase
LIALENEFKDAMSDDFNTANAITALLKIVKLVNVITRTKELDVDYASQLLTILDNEMWVLGIDYSVLPLSEEDLKLVKDWNLARANKDFEHADIYREEISKRGILL